MTDAEFVREIAQPLSGHTGDYDRLLQLIGDARVVLLGEGTQGY
jgi:erythromycin esterase-like protein